MTVLPPDADKLAHLVRVGQKLLAADVEISAARARAHAIAMGRKRGVDLGFMPRPDPTAMVEAATGEADRALDGNYGISHDTAALARALAMACKLHAETPFVPGNGPIRDAEWHFREAARLIQLGLNQRQNADAARRIVDRVAQPVEP
jgi:hypothetical protein